MKCKPRAVFPAPEAACQHCVQRRNAAGHPLRAEGVGFAVWYVSEPGEQVQSLLAEPVAVLAGQEAAAAQFPDLQVPHVALACPDGAQGHDRVRDGELRQQRDVGGRVFA